MKIYTIITILIFFTVAYATVAYKKTMPILKKLGPNTIEYLSTLKGINFLKLYIFNKKIIPSLIASLMVVVFFGLGFKYNFYFIDNIYIKLSLGLILYMVCNYLKINMISCIKGEDISKKRSNYNIKFFLLSILMYFISILSSGYFLGLFVALTVIIDNEIYYLSGPAEDLEREIARVPTPQIEPTTTKQKALDQARLLLQEVDREIDNGDSKFNNLRNEFIEKKDRHANYKDYYNSLSKYDLNYEAAKRHDNELYRSYRSTYLRLWKERNKLLDDLLKARDESIKAEKSKSQDDLTVNIYFKHHTLSRPVDKEED